MKNIYGNMMPDIDRRKDTESERAADRIFDAIVDRVLSGQLRPGDMLSEQAIAEDFSVSRTPVREALQHLKIAGLAERGARRAFKVARLDVATLRDLFETMGEIEALCAEYCARRMSMQERMELKKIVDDGEECVRTQDFRAYRHVNGRFHKAIFSGTHNQSLEQLAQHVRVRTTPYRDSQFRTAERLNSSQAEHRCVLAAILDENPDDARKAMRDHIASSAMVVNQIARDEVEQVD